VAASPTSSHVALPISLPVRAAPPPVAAASLAGVPIAGASAGSAIGGAGNGHGNGHGEGGGAGGFLSGLLHRIFNPRTLIFAGLGAAAAMYIPPLAVLGGPIGGAIAGALLSMVL
jgi:hypothetical protein